MKINKCDYCEKIIDEKKEAYYEIPEIVYNAPDSHEYRVFLRTAESFEVGEEIKSWASYENITICIPCFWSERAKAFREIVEKRIDDNDSNNDSDSNNGNDNNKD